MTNALRKPLHSLLFTSAACVLSMPAFACNADVAPASSAPATNSPASGVALNGTWQTPCYQSAQTRLVYSNLELTGTYTEYSDTACTTPRHIATWTGRASVGQEMKPGVYKLDLSFNTFRSKALTDTEATSVNQNKYCGLTDWASGVERDILGLDCYGFAIPKGGKSVDIYQVNGDSLLFGKGSKIVAAPTEADRPTDIDPMRPFARR
jgi:hypothetical protein